MRLIFLCFFALAACSPPVVADLTAGAEARCREAMRLYDADRNAKAAALTLGACIR